MKSDSPINLWGRLYRTSYFVCPRLALEAMPYEWQERFVALMDEAFTKLDVETPDYYVLRTEHEFTTVVHDDPDDEYSTIREFHHWRSDPWANYRHGSIKEFQE